MNEQNYKHKIEICMGSSCFIRGNNKNLEILKNCFKTDEPGSTVQLIGKMCENRCNKGPVIIIDGKEHINMQSEKLLTLLDETGLL